MARDELADDLPAAVDFLQAYAPGGPWCLVAIEPDPPEGQNARAPGMVTSDPAFALTWLIQRRNWNLYYAVNETVTTVTTTPTKDQITRHRGIHVDLDLPKTGVGDQQSLLRRLQSMDPPPTFIVFSGGGYQAKWDFPEPLAGDERLRVEAACRELIDSLPGADPACFNSNRLFRLPGTINRLSRVKRQRGREPAVAAIVEVDWTRRHRLGVDPIPRPTLVEPTEPTVIPLEPRRGDHDIEDLPAKLRKVIVTGDASRWGGDRSDAVFYVCCALIRFGWSDDEIFPILTDARYLISAHVREQSRPETYAQRQLANARERIATDWERTASGVIKTRSQSNIRRALASMNVAFSHNRFSMRNYVNGATPPEELGDIERNHLLLEIDRRFGFLPDTDLFKMVLGEMCHANQFHPVVDWLAEVEPTWDGVPRVEEWLIKCANAEDTPYVRAISKIVLVAAVRRVRQPGCKFDEMLILIDPRQGTEKSTAIRVLGRRPEWVTDGLPLNANAKETIELMTGKWIAESSELVGMSRREVASFRHYLSQSSDRARLAYREEATEVQRQWIVIGTSNELIFLRDSQNRRIWPVRVDRFNIPLLESIVDQLWAEAAYLERQGESIRLDRALWPEAAKIQEAARVIDPWMEIFAFELGDMTGKLAATDAWKIIDKQPGNRLQEDNRRFGAVMRELGWERTVQRFGPGSVPQSAYVKGTKDERLQTVYVHRDPVTKVLHVGHDRPDFTKGDGGEPQRPGWERQDF